jgi:hypothetical protein
MAAGAPSSPAAIEQAEADARAYIPSLNPAATPVIEQAQVAVDLVTDDKGMTFANAAQLASGIDHLALSGLSGRDAAALAAGKPLTVLPAQRREAEILMTRLMADPSFVKAYLNGGHREQAQMMEINLRLVAGVVGA